MRGADAPALRGTVSRLVGRITAAAAVLPHDAKYAFRKLARDRGFTAVALLTLIVSMAAVIAAYSIINRIYFQPLPFPKPGALVQLFEANSTDQFLFSIPNFVDLRRDSQAFESMAIVTPETGIVTGTESPAAIDGAAVSAGFFDLFGIAAVEGRTFGSADIDPSLGELIVISNRLRRGRFGADASVVGRTIQLAHVTYTVVGVMASTFDYPSAADYWRLCRRCENSHTSMRNNIRNRVIARLDSGVSIKAATADADRVALAIHRRYPDPKQNQMTRVDIVPLRDTIAAESSQIIPLLAAAFTFLLLIACVNLATANIARNAARQEEFIVRAALGANRARIVCQLLVESLILSVIGGIIGLACATWIVRGVATHAELPRAAELTVDIQSTAFAFGLAVIVSLFVGLLPALRLRTGQWGEGGMMLRQTRVISGSTRTRNVLVGTEVAMSLVLLVGAGLAVRSLQRVLNEPPGFDPRGMFTFQPYVSYEQVSTPAAAVDYVSVLLTRLRSIPGVEGAAAASTPPLGTQWTGFIDIEGRDEPRAGAGYNLVSDDFFRVAGIQLIRGRLFTSADNDQTGPVTVINRAFADRYWPGESPLGKRIRSVGMDQHSDWLTIVGEVADVHNGSLESDISPQHYVSIRQRPDRARQVTFFLRSGLTAAAIEPAIHEAVRRTVPGAPAIITTIDETIHNSTRKRRITVVALAGLGIAAMVLAVIGIYGVLSYTVALRQRDTGIRIALGADPRGVVVSNVSQMLRPVATGLAVGLLGVMLMSRTFESMLYGVSPMDPTAILFASVLLLLVSAAAAYVPARRAAKMDPVSALRME